MVLRHRDTHPFLYPTFCLVAPGTLLGRGQSRLPGQVTVGRSSSCSGRGLNPPNLPANRTLLATGSALWCLKCTKFVFRRVCHGPSRGAHDAPADSIVGWVEVYGFGGRYPLLIHHPVDAYGALFSAPTPHLELGGKLLQGLRRI